MNRRMLRLAKPVLLTGAALALCLAPAGAQSFNVDFGNGFGTPETGYVAASGQGGFWHASNGNSGEPEFLFDSEGRPGKVSISFEIPFGEARFFNPLLRDGDRALMNDYLDLHSVPSRLVIDGLEAGRYWIYTYAWAPDNAAWRTTVAVDHQEAQAIGGEWPGQQRWGMTYALHPVEVAPGRRISIYLFGIGKGTLNGLQIVPF